MKIRIYPTYDDMSKATADFIADHIRQKPDSLLCFPSGESPTGTLHYLAAYARSGKADFSRCHFVGLDEWVGMDENDPGSCKHYMYTHLFRPLEIRQEQITFFDAKASKLDKECHRIDAFIFARGPIDLLLVGLGLNGHIGLNEPGVSFDLYSHYIQLAELTKHSAQKYFTSDTRLEQGITIGIKHMLEAKTAVLIAGGEKKASVIQQALEGEVTRQVPASILQQHANSYIFLDQGAASLLKNKG